MAIDERSRHALFSRLKEVLGEEHAAVLIEYLPPVGWADVATKHDLGELEKRLDVRLAALRFELLAGITDKLNSQTRTMILSIVGAIVGVGSLVLATNLA